MVGFKNSYMVFEVFLDPDRGLKGDDPIKLEQSNVSKAIEDIILLNFGECRLASSLGLFKVKYVNPITKLCIIRASREEHQKVWSAITMVRSIENCPVLFNLLDLSGSIRACQVAALKCDEMKFEEYNHLAGAVSLVMLIRACKTAWRRLKFWSIDSSIFCHLTLAKF